MQLSQEEIASRLTAVALNTAPEHMEMVMLSQVQIYLPQGGGHMQAPARKATRRSPAKSGGGQALANEGMARSYSGTSARWKEIAFEVVHRTALECANFTADEVWYRFPEGFEQENKSGLGAVIRQAADKGWFVNSGQTARSNRPSMHRKHQVVWTSLIHSTRVGSC